MKALPQPFWPKETQITKEPDFFPTFPPAPVSWLPRPPLLSSPFIPFGHPTPPQLHSVSSASPAVKPAAVLAERNADNERTRLLPDLPSRAGVVAPAPSPSFVSFRSFRPSHPASTPLCVLRVPCGKTGSCFGRKKRRQRKNPTPSEPSLTRRCHASRALPFFRLLSFLSAIPSPIPSFRPPCVAFLAAFPVSKRLARRRTCPLRLQRRWVG